MTQRGATLPLCRTQPSSSACRRARRRGRRPSPYAVVVRRAARAALGFVVDKLVGQQDIVIKALGQSLKKVRGFAGATELGDQRVGLVLDAAGAHRRGILAVTEMAVGAGSYG